MLQTPSNLLNKNTAVSLKMSEVYFFPITGHRQPNRDTVLPAPLKYLLIFKNSCSPRLISSSDHSERELHAEPVCLLVKRARNALNPTDR